MALATVWLGTYGAMQQLRHPGRGFEIDPVKVSAVQELLGGGNVVDEAPVLMRRYSLPYNALTDTQRDLLAALHARHYGPGPYAFTDPTVTNLFPVNVQSAGASTGTTDGFTPNLTTTVSYAATGGLLGFSSIPWLVPSGLGGTKTLTLGARELPAITGTPVTFSVHIKASAAATSTTFRIAWKNASGGLVSNTDATVSIGTTAARQSVSAANPPALAVSAALQVVYTATPGSALTFTVDGPQVEYTGTLSAFQRSLGLPWVVVMAAKQQVQFLSRTDVGYELLEVA